MPQQRRLPGRAHGAAVIDGQPGVIAVVHAGDHAVHRLRDQPAQERQPDAVRRSAGNGEALRVFPVQGVILHIQRVGKGDPMAGGAHLAAGGAHADPVAPLQRRFHQGHNAHRTDPVVIDQ